MFSESRMSASGSSELNALRKKLNEAMGENFAQYMMFLRQEQIVDIISYHEVFKKLINLFGLKEIILLSKSFHIHGVDFGSATPFSL